MSSKYEFLVHKKFIEQLDKAKKSQPKYIKKINTALKKSMSDPNNTGQWMRNLPLNLQGKVRREWVGGSGGLRYIFFVDNNLKVVLPCFISEEIKPNFSYEKSDWDKFVGRIADALQNGLEDEFEIWDDIKDL